MKILIVGHGRMGQLVEALAPSYDAEIVGVVDETSAATLADRERWRGVDVTIEFSHAQAFLENLPALVALGGNLVVGTTGWQPEAAAVRGAVEQAGLGAVVAANFSVGANLLDALAETAGRLVQPHADYGAFIHESHHAAKRDAPSGTALALKGALERGGLTRPIDVSSTRAGFIPGIHTVGFDGPSETVTLSHSVRDRATFAHGALVAARWVRGRRGWFTMQHVLGLREAPSAPRAGGS
jgi:4-hydroxy-tetrahydrodipicolinate reductase